MLCKNVWCSTPRKVSAQKVCGFFCEKVPISRAQKTGYLRKHGKKGEKEEEMPKQTVTASGDRVASRGLAPKRPRSGDTSRASSAKSVGIYRSSACATRLARAAAKTMSVVVLGSIYTKGVTPETPELLLSKEFDVASLRGGSPVVVSVDTETVEPEMIRSLEPHCPPVLFSLPRRVPRMLAAIKANHDLVIVDPLPGLSTTARLMLMACDTVVFSFDGTRGSCSSLRLFLRLVPSWIEQYKQILHDHRPRIVIFTQDTESGALAADIASRIVTSGAVVCGPIAALLAHLKPETRAQD